MKITYTIGRDESCDIFINDVTNVVSRQHAVLRIDGKHCWLTDHSTNGTYRNGIRLIPNIEYPINRGDDISFSNIVSLDWGAIPEFQKKNMPVWLYIFLPFIVLLLAGSSYYFWPRKRPHNLNNTPVIVMDSLNSVKSPADTVKKDSLVVLEDVLSKKKTIKKTVEKKSETPEISQKSFEDYKDEDDVIIHDAL